MRRDRLSLSCGSGAVSRRKLRQAAFETLETRRLFSALLPDIVPSVAGPFPHIAYDTIVGTQAMTHPGATYTAATGTLVAEAPLLEINQDPSTSYQIYPIIDSANATDSDGVLNLHLKVNPADGSLIHDPSTTDNVQLIGGIDLNNNGQVDPNEPQGVLLSGHLTAFGYDFPSAPQNDYFLNFRFTATGGLLTNNAQLASYGLSAISFAGQDIGMDMVLNGPAAVPSFGSDFSFSSIQGLLTPTQPLAGAISGNVYCDTNLDNQFDKVNENGEQGATVTLKDSNGNIVATALTDANGAYSFGSVLPGTYTLSLAGTSGGHLAEVSHTGVTISPTQTVVVTGGGASADNNFAEVQKGSISGYVYNDQNNNGVQDVGESGIYNASLSLTGTDYLGNPVSTPVSTFVDGSYSFADLLPGTYTVSVGSVSGYLPDKINTGSSTVTLQGCENNLINYNFGELKPVTVLGTVYCDKNTNGQNDDGAAEAISGATLTLSGTDDRGNAVNSTTSSDASGFYSFGNLRPGQYVVTVSNPDTTHVLETPNPVSLGTSNAGQTDMANFGYVELTPVGGSVLIGSAGIPGVTMTLTGSTITTPLTAITGSNGSFSFGSLLPGNYTITEGAVPAGYLPAAGNTGSFGFSLAGCDNAAVSAQFLELATPKIVTTASGPVTLGSAAPTLSDSAVVSGGYNETGTLVFTLSGPGGFLYTQNVTLNGDGTYSASTTLPTVGNIVGTYSWSVSYAGDANNVAAVDQGGAAEQTVVSPATPSIVTSQQPASAIVGNAVADQATVSGGFNPTGFVTFNLYNNPNGTGTPIFTDANEPLVAGIATSKGYIPTGTGTLYWVATYSGDANNISVTSGVADEPVSITPATPAITTTPGATTTVTGGGNFATIGFWHNKNGQAVITNYSGSVGNSLASNYVSLFGTSSNVYTGTSLAGKTNADVASIYLNLWTPSGLQKNTYVQAFAVALGAYGGGGGAATFNVGSNGAAFGVANNTTLSVSQILAAVNANFNPATGLFYGGNSTLTSAANNVLNAINVSGETSGGGSTVTVNSLNDAATLSGGYGPTGTITFYLMAPGSTAGTPLTSAVYTDTVTVNGDGTYTTASGTNPGGYMPTLTGTYQWVAVYSGDGNNNTILSPFGSEPWTVGQQSPTVLSTTPNITSVTLGGCQTVVLKDTADIEMGANPTGTITFYLFGPGATPVSDGHGGYTGYLDKETVQVNGNGNNYTTTVGYTLPANAATGTYQWDAVYSGDANNVGDVFLNDPAERVVVSAPATPVVAGQFATIGFWHNKNGQAVINSFNGSSTSTALGNWMATTFPHLFGASNPYTGTSLAGKTNAQIAAVYNGMWNPNGVTKNTYVQAFAVALGLYADTTSLGGQSLLSNGLAAKFGFKVTSTGAGTFNIGGNSSAFGGASVLTVLQIMQTADANFSPSTGLFYGGDQAKTSALNNVLNGINTTGDITLVTDGSVSLDDQALVTVLHPMATGTLTVAVDSASFAGDPQGDAELARIADAIAALNASLGSRGVNIVETFGDDSVDADTHLHLAATTSIGGVADGVLGVTQYGGQEIYIVSGWNFYTGTDAAGIASNQYDFETVIAHELGHALGLGHSTDGSSVMYPYLGTAESRHDLSANDLALIDEDAGIAAEPLRAAPKTAGPIGPMGPLSPVQPGHKHGKHGHKNVPATTPAGSAARAPIAPPAVTGNSVVFSSTPILSNDADILDLLHS